jgi:hypothetical protein
MYYKSHNDTTETITIRRSTQADRSALERLAQRDSADLPAGELLVALAGEEIYAAISVDTREVIADPFQRTEEAVGMLLIRAAQLRPSPRPSLRARVLGGVRRSSGALAPQPAGTLRPIRSGGAAGRRAL